MNEQETPALKCQNCQLPLHIDTSLLDLSIAQRNLLLNSTPNFKPSSYTIPDDRLQRLSKIKYISNLTLQDSVFGDSFVFLSNEADKKGKHSRTSTNEPSIRVDETSGDEQNSELITPKNEYGQGKTLSTQVTALANIFNILSSKSNIDYPVCQDCCDILIQRLKTQYADAIEERDTYTQFLHQLEEQKKMYRSYPNKTSEEESRKAVKERDVLFQQLLELEHEDEELDKVLTILEDKLVEKNQYEEAIMERNNMKDLERIQFYKEVQSLNNQYEYTMNRLDMLRKINIYNETFKISHEGPFGTINGLRLGGFDYTPVPWKEISAAIGQVVLLLATISTQLNFKIDGYKLQPMGSFSKLLKYDTNSQEWLSYEAYNDENFKVTRLFRRDTSFDKAMECLLEIIQQLASCLARSNVENLSDNPISENGQSFSGEYVELPYSMNKDKINGSSIKLFGSKPTLEWTTAMKLVLTNIKWLLAFSSSRLAQTAL